MELTVAITGASGSIYAQRTLQMLVNNTIVKRVNLIMSRVAGNVARIETGAEISENATEKVKAWVGLNADSKILRIWKLDNYAAKPSSGSYKQAGMIIVPCSMGTLGAIASGAGTNLIHRAADVTLKERRKLVIVPRETPMNAIHLENMLRLSRAGAQILPASPGFYHRPKTLEELVDHLCFRILDQFDIPHSNETIWKGEDLI
ncbi:MAG: UbiX family flavin prenyltransferase [Pyrinomonadaceae bacterium]